MPSEESGMNWKAATARLTTFTNEPVPIEAAAEWWAAVVGSDPESEQAQRPIQQAQFQGRLGDLPLGLRLLPGRVDWYLGDFPSGQGVVIAAGGPVEWGLIGDLDAASNAIATVAKQWLPLGPSISRIAYGSLQVFEVPSRAEGYRVLDGFLDSVTIDADGTTDFLLQLNRRRPSGVVKGLELNRLMKWFVLLMRDRGVLSISPQGVGVVAPEEPEADDSHYVGLELDLNTAPEYQSTFDPESALAVWAELLSLGRDIADNGDRA